ncbi:MAG: hypothetical protein HWE14_11195 [Flavobacteriia bacterium]|nr:hypothetical protein [Flavobacteriia bacterium]
MKKILALLAFISVSVLGYAQAEIDEDGFQSFSYQEGDTTFHMRQYVFVMLKAGPNKDEFTPEQLREIQAGHMAHLNKLAEDGKLALAGPFGDDGEWRGILIFNVPTVEEVEELVNEDPAIKAGRLEAEIHPLWAARGTKLP